MGRGHPPALNFKRQAGRHPFSKAVFWKAGATIRVLRSLKIFHIQKACIERATAGIIVSGTKPEVVTAAISGWQASDYRGQNVLDNIKYVKLVQYFSSILEFKMPRSFRDNNDPSLPEHVGRFFACHVEKKLAVFWIIAVLKAVLGTTDLRRARELKRAEISEEWRSAWIFLDHIPCVNCLAFLDRIKQETGIHFYVETRPLLTQRNRGDEKGCRRCACDRCRRRFKCKPLQNDASIETNELVAETEPESGISDEEDASGLVPMTSHLENGTGGEQSLGRAQETGPMPTRTPNKWRSFFDVKTGRYYGKPVSDPIEALEIP